MSSSIQIAGSEVAAAWLRLRCTCAECGDSRAGLRWLSYADVPSDITDRSIVVDGDTLTVDWSDGHRSHYALSTLLADLNGGADHSVDGADRPRRAPIHAGPEPMTFGYDDCLDDDATLLEALDELADRGVIHLTGAPTTPRGTVELARRFGPVRTTSYGEVQDFETCAVPKTAAHTGRAQHPHTDEPFRYSPPGYLFFHSVAAAPAGQGTTVLVDGFAVAEAMRATNPGSFEVLASTPLVFHRIHDGEVHFEARSRVISLRDGGIEAIRCNQRCLAPLESAAGSRQVIDALRTLSELVEAPANQRRLHLEAGDMLVFDNHRILHGRTGFGDGTGRHLRSCNVDRDAVHSTHRVLAGRLRGVSPRGLAQGPTT